MWSRELCDAVEAILVPSGDRIKELVGEIFEVNQTISLTVHCVYINIYIQMCVWYGDPGNQYDHFAVVIFKTDVIMGHVPKAVSRVFFF